MTGATGYVGSIFARKALEVQVGHSVVGLARSEESARKLQSAWVTPLRGNLEDHGALTKGASDADAFVHLGFVYEFDRPYSEFVQIDQDARLAKLYRSLGSSSNSEQ